MRRRVIWIAAVVALGSAARGAPVDPVADPRLASVRPELGGLLTVAERDGLPVALLTNKVREGLAKSVAPPRILAAVRALHADLVSGRSRAQRLLGSKAPPMGLLRALAGARQAGVPDAAVDALLRALAKPGRKAATPPETVARAVEVLTDLKLAGYPVERALRVVSLVATREPGALARVGSEIGRLRKSEGLTAAEAVDAVGQGLERGDKLDRAVRNAQSEVAASRAAERGRGAAAGKRPR